jgi:dihydropteroate synthase
MTKIMAVLNVTPDSFSDGGRFGGVVEAVAWGIQQHDLGADIVDVGGESTRPGAQRVPVAEERRRVLPVVRGLVAAGVTVSVDTMNAATASAAIDAGASIINDVSGGLADAEMYRLIAAADVTYIAMHWRGASNVEPVYGDVVADVRAELERRAAEMLVWGIDPTRVVLDPGLGFAKTADHNWQLLGRLHELQSLGYPILIGASRKRFLQRFADAEGNRDPATALLSALVARDGAWGVRVHDVPSTLRALDIVTAFEKGAA